MEYKAVIAIDEDRWAKRPYAITIKDEDGNVVERKDSLESRDACYRIADKYGIDSSSVEDVFY